MCGVWDGDRLQDMLPSAALSSESVSRNNNSRGTIHLLVHVVDMLHWNVSFDNAIFISSQLYLYDYYVLIVHVHTQCGCLYFVIFISHHSSLSSQLYILASKQSSRSMAVLRYK